MEKNHFKSLCKVIQFNEEADGWKYIMNIPKFEADISSESY